MTQNDLSPQQARTIAHGLHELARTDGVHPAETMLVQEFFAAAQGEFGTAGDTSMLAATSFDVAQAAQVLDTPELKAVFLQSCVLLAYADGRYSAAERAKVAEFAQALGVPEAERADIEETVSDHLLQQIARIENVEALGEVARELKST
ncbi:MAG TPA: TerB family tellurite resistance protein [Lysobacter sp.]